MNVFFFNLFSGT